MALFCAAIRRDSVSLLMFSFLSHIHVFSSKMKLVSHLTCSYSCIYFYFWFLIVSGLLILVLPVLFLMPVVSLPLRFSILSSSRWIEAPTLSWMPESCLPPSFLDTYSLSMWCKALCMVISFLDTRSILKSFSGMVPSIIFWPSTRPKNAIPRWCTGRKWHIPMDSNRKKLHGRKLADEMGRAKIIPMVHS